MSSPAPLAARRTGDALRLAGETRSRFTWQSGEYTDPVRFGREVLGIRRYWSKQREWLAEFSRPKAWIAISTGQKTGKTEAYITLILWFFATFASALFYLFAPKIEHTNVVLWPRLVKIALEAYRPCAACKPRHDAWLDAPDETAGPRPAPCRACSKLIDPSWINEKDARVGLRAPDGRRVMAYTATKLGALGGLSGEHIAFGTDESSDVGDPVYQAVVGNALGGARGFFIGNPLYPYGWFARAFKDQKGIYSYTAMVSSRMTPNCAGTVEWSDGEVTVNETDDPPIAALADVSGIEKGLIAWRGATAIIAARIDGRFPELVDGQLVQFDVMSEAEQRWNDGLEGDGPLQIGVDVARGTGRDKLTIAPRRGRRIFEVQAHKPGNHARGAELVADVARSYRRPGEGKPRIVYDASGKEGADFGREMRRFAGEFDLYPIRATHPPRQRRLYDKLRDEVAHYFATWLKTGALPPDPELEAELDGAAFVAKIVEITFGGVSWEVSRVISNDEVEKILKRHPDKRDACALSVWPAEAAEAADDEAGHDGDNDAVEAEGASPPGFIDPYAGHIDPYGGRL